MISTIHLTGEKSVTLKTTGHEKARVSVRLAAKADGTKLKPTVYSEAPNVRLQL